MWGAGHYLTRTGMAASAPAVAYFTGGPVTGLVAGVAFGAIFVGHSVVSFFGAKSERASKGNAGLGVMMIRLGDLLAATKVKSTTESEKLEAVRALLGVIELFALEITGLRKGEIAVSVARYKGHSSVEMKLVCRNPGNDTRPVNRSFNATNKLGHRACKAGHKARIVNDLRGFGPMAMESPTQSKVSYRSIVLFPLVGVRDGNDFLVGFLSIDATRPYAFYGNRGNDVVVHCQPIVNHIQAIL